MDLKKEDIKRVRVCCFGELSGGLLGKRIRPTAEVWWFTYYRPRCRARYGMWWSSTIGVYLRAVVTTLSKTVAA